MEAVLSRLGELGAWSYVIVGVMSFLESSAFAGLVVPGETVVLVAGFLAGQEYLSSIGVVVAASVGAALGDSVGYELGHRFGRPLVERWRFQRRALRRTERFFARHGGKAVFLGRFVGFLRAFAPFVAGVSRMPYRRFLLYNVSGAVLWATGVTVLGWMAGANWPVIERWITWIGIGMAGALILFVVLRWQRPRRRLA